MGSTQKLPELQARGRDILTGGFAPAGRQFKENQGAVDMRLPGFGARMQRRGTVLVEVADMWQPGNADCGISPTKDGRLLPSIDHLRCTIPMTDVMGAELDESDVDREKMRREWYVMQVRSPARLTPVHHIIGKSDPAWLGTMHEGLHAARDAWRAKLWEPDALKALMETYEGIYVINWAALPVTKIVAPLTTLVKRLRTAQRAEVEVAALRLRRARAEAAELSRLGDAVTRGKPKDAATARANLGKIAQQYESEARKLASFVDASLLETGHDAR